MTHYAHSLRNAPREHWHSLAEHLEDTGDRAAAIAKKWDAEAWGHAAGRLHDIGKFAPEFVQRLQGGPLVDHATAGAQLAVRSYDPHGRLLAYAIAGHHGGMPDGTGPDDGTLDRRLVKPVGDYAGWSSEMVLPASLPPPRIRPRPVGEPVERMARPGHVRVRRKSLDCQQLLLPHFNSAWLFEIVREVRAPVSGGYARSMTCSPAVAPRAGRVD